jgi:hypothetical protein
VEDIPKGQLTGDKSSGSLTTPPEMETTSSSELSEEEKKRLERLEKAQKMKLALQVEFCNFFV